jgi:alkylhydroperoxidase family enzyme
MSHTAAAVHTVGDREVVHAAIDDPATAPVSDKLRALLAIAGKVQRSGLEVTAEDVAAARAAGANDEDIHDTVLVAAAFSMFNRYVDGLAATTPTDPALYDLMGQRLAQNGYVRIVDPDTAQPA